MLVMWSMRLSIIDLISSFPLQFNSLNYLAKLPPLSADFSSRSKDQSKSLSTEHLVKIFSLAHMSDEKLVEIMGDSIRWTYRKEWDAYPVLSPTREFPPVEPDENLFFINALERWDSIVFLMECHFFELAWTFHPLIFSFSYPVS